MSQCNVPAFLHLLHKMRPKSGAWSSSQTDSFATFGFCKHAGDVEELPEGTKEYNPSIMRIRPSGQESDDEAPQPNGPSMSAAGIVDAASGEAKRPSVPLLKPFAIAENLGCQCYGSHASRVPITLQGSSGLHAGVDGQAVPLQFSDKDEHVYFWFPLLAGLSELTFDPRPDIRYSALEVSFPTDHSLSARNQIRALGGCARTAYCR